VTSGSADGHQDFTASIPADRKAAGHGGGGGSASGRGSSMNKMEQLMSSRRP
jgi:hypothetical protein